MNIQLCHNDIIKTLLYFEVFSHPLSLEEISKFSTCGVDEVEESIAQLMKDDLVFKLGDFYSTKNKPIWAENRTEGIVNAKRIFKKAIRISKFISQFPFVEAVYISGSLSKGVFYENDDVDYFIVTKPNRLWLARTLLIGFKKVFLLNNKKYFCLNYFVTSDKLEVPEKNRFTATEFTTLIPIIGDDSLNRNLLSSNSWIQQYFPNFSPLNVKENLSHGFLKKIGETILEGSIGNFLEKKFQSLTQSYQKKKFQKMKKEEFSIAFKGDENISKHHPNNHQIKVIKDLNRLLTEFNTQYKFNIPLES
jgi:hypothetical protein